ADAGGRPGQNFVEARTNPEVNIYDAVAKALRPELAAGRRVLLTGASAGAIERLSGLLVDHGLSAPQPVADAEELKAIDGRQATRAVLDLPTGFSAGDLLVVTEQDILSDRLTRAISRKRKSETFLAELANFHAGDHVVHADHGIGRYEGLETLDVGGAPHDCLRVIYEGNDKLFVPVENIEVLSRYGGEDAIVALDKLGSAAWQGRKARVKHRIRDIAQQLLKIAAQRKLKDTEPVQRPEGLYDEFCARFPYAETEDQLRAIDEV